jgi:LacI family transcriptional regulator, galactose operon repressor
MAETNGRRGVDTARVTIAQVAAHAGVSPTTVSHVLSGKRLVNAATRDRVEQAVHQLGYRPNIVARNLRTRRTQVIAVIVPDITNPFYGVVTRGLADAVDSHGYATYVCNTDAHFEREQKFLADVLDRGVDGVVLASVDVTQQHLAEPARYGTPVVCLGDGVEFPRVDRVIPDDEGGSRSATAHLAGRGASRIAMITGPPGAGLARVSGYRRALEEAGLTFDPDLIREGGWTRPGGRDAMRALMGLPQRPDAVFCANDLMAIGAMDVVHELGLTVPADVALVGFDDVEAATLVTPPLTTVDNPAYQAGRDAGRLLLERMTGAYAGGRRTVVLPCRLVERQSA